MLRFRRMKTLQQFASVYSALYNDFKEERHLVGVISSKSDARPPWPSGGGLRPELAGSREVRPRGDELRLD